MTIRTLAGTSALVLLMSTPALMADVTPEQVWQSWQDGIASMGNKVTAESATRNGDVLEVINITIGDDAKGTMMLDRLDFQDLGDGTVAVLLNDSFPVTFNKPADPADPASKPSEVVFNFAAPKAEITASGTPEAISYKADADKLTLTVDTIDGAPAADKNAAFELVLEGLASTYSLTGGDVAVLSEDLAAKSISLTAKGKNDTDGSTGDVKASVADLTSKFEIKAPKDFDKVDLTTAMAKGFSVTGSFGFGTSSFDINSTDATGVPTEVIGGLASGSQNLTLDGSKFDYSNDSKGAAFKVVSPTVPLPDASFTYGEAGVHLVMPVAKSDTPADFAFSLNLVDLAPSEAIWGMADSTKMLKHDPASLIIDTKGKATMTRDIFADAAAIEGGNKDAPGLLNALDLTKFNLKALGAEIVSSGSFTFDNTDMTTYSGVPAPTGKIDIKATGVNAVIDTLVKMGLVPQDQAMQGRMMLSMFANTSTTADEMTSTLEFKDKHFFANGQQLQ